MVAAAIAGGAIVGGVASAAMSSSAASKASGAQTSASNSSIAAQQQQFAAIQKLLAPYVSAGTGTPATNYTGPSEEALTRQILQLQSDPAWNQEGASGDAVRNQIRALAGQREQAQIGTRPAMQGSLSAQQDLLGLNGAGSQQAAINQLQNSPAFTAMLQQGNNNILQNASATGGLRNGNTQGALAQFAPQLLAQTIQQQYSNLGGLTSLGANAAAGLGNAGQANTNNISGLYSQQGGYAAADALAQGRAGAGYANAIGSGVGLYAGYGGFGSTQAPSSGYLAYSSPLTSQSTIYPQGAF